MNICEEKMFNGKRAKKILWGIILLLAIAAIIVSALGIWTFPQLSVGGVIWTVLAVLLLIEGISNRSFFMIGMPLAILAIVWKDYIGLSDINNWLLVACGVMLSLALHLIFPKFRKKHDFHVNINGKDYSREEWEEAKKDINTNNSTMFTEASCVEVNSEDNSEVNFGSQTKYYKSQEFQSADLEANFGSIKAFFTDAKMLNDSARVHVECNFGSAELFVPKEWKTEIHTDNSFSGVNHRGEVLWDGVHTLYIDTEVNFGGLTIHHV